MLFRRRQTYSPGRRLRPQTGSIGQRDRRGWREKCERALSEVPDMEPTPGDERWVLWRVTTWEPGDGQGFQAGSWRPPASEAGAPIGSDGCVDRLDSLGRAVSVERRLDAVTCRGAGRTSATRTMSGAWWRPMPGPASAGLEDDLLPLFGSAGSPPPGYISDHDASPFAPARGDRPTARSGAPRETVLHGGACGLRGSLARSVHGRSRVPRLVAGGPRGRSRHRPCCECPPAELLTSST